MFTGPSRNCICDRDFSRTLFRSPSPQFRKDGKEWDGMGVTPASAATTEEKRGSEEEWALTAPPLVAPRVF